MPLYNPTTGADLSPAAILAPTSSARNVIQPTGAGFIPLVSKGAASQTANLASFQDSTAAELAYVDAAGNAKVARTLTLKACSIDGGANGNELWLTSAAGAFAFVGSPNVAFQGGYMILTERTDPGAAAANTVRLYSKDNGSGKTQLMAQFPTGAVQQIAIEP